MNPLNAFRRPAVEAGPLTIAVCIAVFFAFLICAPIIETAMTARIAASMEQSQ